MIIRSLLSALLFLFVTTEAQPVDSSEAGVRTAPLFIYSGGFAAGMVRSLNDDLKDEREQMLKLSWVNLWRINDQVGVFMDADLFLPGINLGGDIGFDIFPTRSAFEPFLGIGVGAHYINKDGRFSDEIGPSGTVHAGFSLDMNETVQIRVRIPYHFVANSTNDQMIGVDVGFMFMHRYRKVKKLLYNP